MMFVIHALDKPLSPLRSLLIDEHRRYLSACPFNVLQAGPLMDDIDEIMIGSLIIVECSDRDEVEQFMAEEPFNLSGLYESLNICRWHQRVNNIAPREGQDMSTSSASLPRLMTGAPAPSLDVSLRGGEIWRLSEMRPEKFTLVIVLRGVHCSFCKSEAETLQYMLSDFTEIGISLLVVTMDDAERAQKAFEDWHIPDLPYAYGLTECQAREWGLYISKRVKPVEPEIFSEPGAFLIQPDGTLYSQYQSTAPWLRLDFAVLYRGIQLAMERGTPPRGAE